MAQARPLLRAVADFRRACTVRAPGGQQATHPVQTTGRDPDSKLLSRGVVRHMPSGAARYSGARLYRGSTPHHAPCPRPCSALQSAPSEIPVVRDFFAADRDGHWHGTHGLRGFARER